MVDHVDDDHVDNDAIEHISGMFSNDKNSFVLKQSLLWNEIKGTLPVASFPVASSSNETFRKNHRNNFMTRDLLTARTTDTSTVSRSTWDKVNYLDQKEKSNMKDLEHFISLHTAETMHPVYRNFLDYSKAMVLAAVDGRVSNNDVTGTENFVKLLAKLAAVLHDIDLSSLTLESQNRESACAKIKSIMKFKKNTKVTYSLYLLTWLNTQNVDDFTLTYGDMAGFHYSVAFHVWKDKHFA